MQRHQRVRRKANVAPKKTKLSETTLRIIVWGAITGGSLLIWAAILSLVL